jgi:hypothetical protein
MRAGFDNKFWPYLNAIRIGVGHIRGSGSITLITGAAGRRAIKGTFRTRRGERSPASDHRTFSTRIRTDTR